MSLLKKRFKFCFKKESYYPAIVKANIVKSKFSIGSSNKKIFFKTFPVQHGRVKAVAYVFEKTAYLSDCNDISIIKNTDLKNLNYLIIDCLKIKDNYAHFKLSETLYIHKHLKPKQTILTNLHSDLDYNFLKQKLPKNIIPAYDGLKLNL